MRNSSQTSIARTLFHTDSGLSRRTLRPIRLHGHLSVNGNHKSVGARCGGCRLCLMSRGVGHCIFGTVAVQASPPCQGHSCSSKVSSIIKLSFVARVLCCRVRHACVVDSYYRVSPSSLPSVGTFGTR